MRWEDWKPFYLRIVREMGYSIEEDRKAAQILRALLLEGDEYILRDEFEAIVEKRPTSSGLARALKKL